MRRTAALSLVALLLLPGLCLAQSSAEDPVDEDFPLHWAFANSFGTGWYTVRDTQTFILRITPRLPLGQFLDSVELELKLPVTLGFHDFDLTEEGLSDLDEKFGTFTIVPGLEAVIPVGPRFRIVPSVGFGHGWEFRGKDNAWIYTAGVNTFYDFGWKSSEFTFASGLDFHGYTPDDGRADSFSRLTAGLDWRLPIGASLFERDLFVNPHALYRLYFNGPQRELIDLAYQLELGLAVGFPEVGIPIIGGLADRVGIAYSWSDNRNFRGIRLYLWFPM